MKTILKLLAALLSLAGAAFLVRLAAEVMSSCNRSYIEIDPEN